MPLSNTACCFCFLWDGIFSGMVETAELAETAESLFTDYGQP